METRKIALACFMGGALFCLATLVFMPIYWPFALVAGMAGGYLSYEFREVLKAIPVALRATGRGSVYAWDGLIALAKGWLSESHPFVYSAMIVATPFYIYYVLPALMSPDMRLHGSTISLLMKMTLAPLAFVEMVWVMIFPMAILAFIGARVGEKCYWWPLLMPRDSLETETRLLEAKGLRREPLNYRNLARWFTKGVGLTVLFFVWILWKYIAIDVWVALYFFGQFAWHLFKLIHSEKRLLCAIDGTLGGAVSYIWFASSTMSFPEQVMFVIFGGLLGATFGVANWEIVSKRILRVASVRNR